MLPQKFSATTMRSGPPDARPELAGRAARRAASTAVTTRQTPARVLRMILIRPNGRVASGAMSRTGITLSCSYAAAVTSELHDAVAARLAHHDGRYTGPRRPTAAST